MRTLTKPLAVVALMLLAPAAGAHSVGAHSAGFADGLLHPLIGFDHLLALIGLGLWAGWLGVRAHWRLPVAFLGGLSGGALLAWSGASLPLVEPMNAMSVLLFGVLAASSRRTSLLLGGALAFTFALFHGFAHGAELPLTAQPALYVLGFLLSSALVQGAAVLLSAWLCNGHGSKWMRLAGGAVAGLGAGWMIGG